MIIIFVQYRHIGDTAARYRCRQADSSIADTDNGIGVVANPGRRLSLSRTACFVATAYASDHWLGLSRAVTRLTIGSFQLRPSHGAAGHRDDGPGVIRGRTDRRRHH